MVPTGPAWHFLIPDPTGNVPPCPQGSSGNPGINRKGARDGERIPNQNSYRGKETTHGRENSSHHLGIPSAPPHPSIPQKLNTNGSKGISPKSPPGLCHSPSELKGTKPLRYKLMLKLFVKHLKFSVTYFKYPPCSPAGGSKPNTNWEPMGEREE